MNPQTKEPSGLKRNATAQDVQAAGYVLLGTPWAYGVGFRVQGLGRVYHSGDSPKTQDVNSVAALML